jgi:hypothetical protein
MPINIDKINILIILLKKMYFFLVLQTTCLSLPSILKRKAHIQ